MMTSLTRREILTAGSAAALLGATPGWARKRPPRPLRAGTFPSSVIAGRPQRQGVLLWTQLAPGEAPGRLELEVARDADFRRVVHRGLVEARAEDDLVASVRLRSRRLRPGERYFYRFATRTSSSPVGRFTTARPPGSQEPLRVGFFSCQEWGAGYYAAHAGLAAEECDLIVCLGDYVYENNAPGTVPGREDRTSAGESGECELLDEYRAKYRLYRSDPALRAMHESAAFVMTWDDHEVEDNHAGEHEGKSGDRRPARRIPYPERRRNAYRAFFEQMPVVAIDGASRLYRRVPLGGQADLFVLDLRQYRSDQTCGDQPGVPCPEPADPAHTLLGAEQLRWFKDALSRSRANWKLVASSVELMSWDGIPGVPLNRDGWDGYPADRRALGEHVLREGVRDIAVMTGDVHHFAAGRVTTSGRDDAPVWATEFIGGSMTSEFLGEPYASFAERSRDTNPHAVYHEFTRKGYGVMDLSAQELAVRFRSPRTVTARTSEIDTLAEFRVPRGTAAIEPR